MLPALAAAKAPLPAKAPTRGAPLVGTCRAQVFSLGAESTVRAERQPGGSRRGCAGAGASAHGHGPFLCLPPSAVGTGDQSRAPVRRARHGARVTAADPPETAAPVVVGAAPG